MIIIDHIRPAKIHISFGIRKIQHNDKSLCCPREKSFSPRVSNESKAMILIIYCRSNAQADLSHRYMRIRQCSFCVAVVTS